MHFADLVIWVKEDSALSLQDHLRSYHSVEYGLLGSYLNRKNEVEGCSSFRLMRVASKKVISIISRLENKLHVVMVSNLWLQCLLSNGQTSRGQAGTDQNGFLIHGKVILIHTSSPHLLPHYIHHHSPPISHPTLHLTHSLFRPPPPSPSPPSPFPPSHR